MTLRIWILSPGRGYREHPTGPFPVTAEDFLAVRKIVRDGLATGDFHFGGVAQCVQSTLARPAIIERWPNLTDLDVFALGHVMTSEFIRIQDGVAGRIFRCPE
jgi:hypothetical protein